jgi:hypothetical protein
MAGAQGERGKTYGHAESGLIALVNITGSHCERLCKRWMRQRKKERRWGVSRKTGMRKKKKKKKGAGAEGGDKNTSGRSDGRPLTPNQDGPGAFITVIYRNFLVFRLSPFCPAGRILPIAAMQNFSIRATWLVWGVRNVE